MMKRAGEYASGIISFAEFARANTQDWRAMARYLLRRFPTSDLDEQDVVQELLLASWRRMQMFDPERGVTPERYCTFNAIADAKKQICRQSRALEEELAGLDVNVVHDSVPAGQASEFERNERLHQLVNRCGSLKDAVVLLAFFREEDRSQAAAALYRDPEIRRLCRFGSEPEAARKVRQSLNRFKNKGMKCRNQITHR